jgi:NAD(P)-dependent dehydrogenase (short-subunit alcohol dehydrogenase family)
MKQISFISSIVQGGGKRRGGIAAALNCWEIDRSEGSACSWDNGFQWGEVIVPQLEGKRVVVFGATGGIGLAASRFAQAEGAKVTLIGRDVGTLQSAVGELAGSEWRAADVRDEAAVAAALASLTRIDHLFISIGLGGASDILMSDMNSLRQPFEERIFGTFTIVRAAAPKMKEGSITLMSGMNASRVRPGASAQTAALCAVESLARTLAFDLAPIRVNAVAPGWIDTSRLERTFGTERASRVEAIARQLPGKRIGRVDEVARAVLMLMTNAYMNGEVLHIDGAGRHV